MSNSQAMYFKARVGEKLADVALQKNLAKVKGKFVEKRAQAMLELDDFEATRDAAQQLRDRVLMNLDAWLLQFEAEATRRGATVLWAEDAAQVCELVIEIARKHEVKKVTKSKSMVSEEARLDQALEAAGIQPVETDLGEYILQINNYEAPSHIIAPVVHKNVDQVADLFARVHGTARKTDIPALTREAREVLREHFLSADMGISGGNFLVAETGSVALVTNEGNADMSVSLPNVHVAITGIEKVIPTLEDLATLMRLLPRSATGQSISNYFTVLTGPRAADETDGPEHMYFILVDAGRANLLGGEFQEMLRCIRCGACMNHCPVYQTIGGHAYGWVYPGPMGSLLTPLFTGIENAIDLPHASTLCNQCGVVCPVKIPLPELLRTLREKQFERGLRPATEVWGLRLWAYLAARPRLYAFATRAAARLGHWIGGEHGVLKRLPFDRLGWTFKRDMPAPQGDTFRAMYAKRQAKT